MFSHKKRWNAKVSDEKKKRRIPIRYWIYLLLMVFCLVGIVYVLRMPEYKVKVTVIEGAVLTKEEDVQKILDEYLSYKYFYLIPQSNIWIYPKSKILERILALESVENAEIKLRRDDQTLFVRIKERKHEYVWCKEGDCYYMDRKGYIFATAPDFEGNIFLTFEGMVEGDPVGQSFLGEEVMSKLDSFILDLENLGLDVVSVRIVTEREVRIILHSNTTIIVSLGDFEEVIKNIETLIVSDNFRVASGGIENLEYIDLRYGKKAFWK